VAGQARPRAPWSSRTFLAQPRRWCGVRRLWQMRDAGRTVVVCRPVDGSPVVGGMPLAGAGRLAVGEWLRTTALHAQAWPSPTSGS
jgi:hypothetical protein